MSLITDLLAKVKYQEQKRDVPPALKATAIEASKKKTFNKRLMIPLIVSLVVVVIGVASLFLLDYLTGKPQRIARVPTDTRAAAMPPSPTPQQVINTAQTATGAQQPSSLSTIQPETASTASAEKPAALKTADQGAKNRSKTMASLITDGDKRRGNKQQSSKENKEHTVEIREIVEEKKAGIEQTGTYEESPPISKQDRDAYLYSARTYEHSRDFPQAVADYKKVLASDPQNYIIMNNIAGALINMGSYDEAIKYAGNALNIKSNFTPSLMNLGIAYGQLSRFGESENNLKRAIAIEPSNRLALLNLGILFEKRNDLEGANEHYLKLSETGDVQGYLGLARISEKQGRTAAAVNYYRQILYMSKLDSKIKSFVNDRLTYLGS